MKGRANAPKGSVDQRFSRADRLRTREDFRRVYDRRCSVADDTLIVYVCETQLDHPRLGLSVSRKVGNAVVRNRWKRIIRDSFRRSKSEVPCVDYIVIPRRGVQLRQEDIAMAFRRLAVAATKRLLRKRAKAGRKR